MGLLSPQRRVTSKKARRQNISTPCDQKTVSGAGTCYRTHPRRKCESFRPLHICSLLHSLRYASSRETNRWWSHTLFILMVSPHNYVSEDPLRSLPTTKKLHLCYLDHWFDSNRQVSTKIQSGSENVTDVIGGHFPLTHDRHRKKEKHKQSYEKAQSWDC